MKELFGKQVLSKSNKNQYLYKRTGKPKWLQQAEDYRHEALEHASLADDNFETLKAVVTELKTEADAAVEETR